MELAFGVLGWTPQTFWAATPGELWAACYGDLRARTTERAVTALRSRKLSKRGARFGD